MGTDMSKPFRKMRTHRFRLLASMLVVLAMLCNGIGLAHAHSMVMKKDCCAEMTGHKKAMDHCDGDKPAPLKNMHCDDQCMARCIGANGLLSVPLTIAPNVLATTALPLLKSMEHTLAEIGPDLRPPIYS